MTNDDASPSMTRYRTAAFSAVAAMWLGACGGADGGTSWQQTFSFSACSGLAVSCGG